MHISGVLTFEDRLYVCNTPPFVEKQYPLMLGLHGGGGTGGIFRIQMNIGTTIGEEVILLFPTATINQDDVTAWNSGGPFNPGVDDVAYLSRLLNAWIATNRVDPRQIYIVGHSNGAMMGYRLVSELPANFAGLYSMSGDLLVDNTNLFRGKYRETHGTIDQNVPINGGYGADSFYPINYPSLYDVVPSFTKVPNPGIGNLNPLVGYGHDMPDITSGLIAQGTTLQQNVRTFILG